MRFGGMIEEEITKWFTGKEKFFGEISSVED
jgi:hypothetical protein